MDPQTYETVYASAKVSVTDHHQVSISLIRLLADKVRRNLVENAKVKKSYDKLKARERAVTSETQHAGQVELDGGEVPEPASLEPHPERQALMEGGSLEPISTTSGLNGGDGRDTESANAEIDVKRRQKRKPAPFTREQRAGEKHIAEANRRREEMAAANAERERKLVERARRAKAMAKARGRGPQGQRKLGRESTILLEKVKQMVGVVD